MAQCTLNSSIRSCLVEAPVLQSGYPKQSSICGPPASAWVQQALHFLAQRTVLPTGPIQECAPFWRADMEDRVVDFLDPFPAFRRHNSILGLSA